MTQTAKKESSACIMQLLVNAISALYKWLKQLRKNPQPALCNCCLMQYRHYTNDSNSYEESSACIMQLLLNAILALYKWLKELEKDVGLHYAIVASCNNGFKQMTQTARKESSACIMQLLVNAISALYKWLKQLRKNPRPALCNCCLMQYRHYTNDSNS